MRLELGHLAPAHRTDRLAIDGEAFFVLREVVDFQRHQAAVGLDRQLGGRRSHARVGGILSRGRRWLSLRDGLAGWWAGHRRAALSLR